jgi:hypothetical protein
MPYFVDVSVYRDLKNADLKAHIERVGKKLYEREAAYSAADKTEKPL